ncbi:putative E1-like protein-activating [Lyophyllum shimeji]|uniref:Ubiquitin-like modifier-activating enzyme ATG7 n=1 Tax=Lyophyllum shimeji TaxID=47721 RepID=A0A9P3PIA1_LYOSH|nr:putative E1-like protein-activating [Lyophyllum shimeji]
MPLVQFAPFSSLIHPSFWHELTNLKIDVLRLSDEALPISGSYSVGRSVTDRESGSEIALACNLTVGSESFDKEIKASPGTILASGTFKNYNTIEEFKAADKAALFNHEVNKIWDRIVITRDTRFLNHFLLITFADLKKYKYYYWFAFPAFVAKPAWEILDDGWKDATEEFSAEQLFKIHEQLRSRSSPLPFFLIQHDASIGPVEDFASFFGSTPTERPTIGFVDPSAHPTNPGWPLRNLLAYLRALHPGSSSTLRVLCWRDTEIPISSWKSRVGVIKVESGKQQETDERPSAVGWEKNPQGKLGPRMADLAPMMDPTKLANQAVDLNLKLMRWRILPALDLDKISSTKCLLLGAGTLGCYVARTLMGWGVRTITFVDSARVSFSNPVRQPLFEFEDCLAGGKPKAECAAARLKKIYPGINASGHSLSVPMPGHPVPATSVAQTKKDVERLEALIAAHDAIFLLMDSRESRWLPTVIGAAKGKIVLNAALGFDTFLVMRHGARCTGLPPNSSRLGCYYCNDIVAPSDSLTDRTLDQMCTVTRPGLASIAAATAVELLVSLLQHPDGMHAAAPQANQDPGLPTDGSGDSVLGLVPHQLRGFLAQFRNIHIVGAAYDCCTGCSETVLQAYEKEGFEMMLKAFNDSKYLPTLTGLDKLYDEGEAVLESVDWDEDGDADF